jgi:hypothetical protein
MAHYTMTACVPTNSTASPPKQNGTNLSHTDEYLLLHETTHRVHYQNAPDMYYAQLTEHQRQLAMNFVSKKAATNAAEFVAKSFCGMKTKSKPYL